MTATQSAGAQSCARCTQYPPVTRRDLALRGSSAGDTLNEVQLRFLTLKEALAFAKKQGLDGDRAAQLDATA